MLFRGGISFLGLVLCLCIPLEASAKSIAVHSESELRNAVAVGQTQDTVLLKGFYCLSEALVIQRSLALIGHEDPVLDFQSLSSGIVIKADSVTIKGLRIHNIKHSNINDYAAILADRVAYIDIAENHIFNSFFGVYMADSRKSRVHHNLIVGITTTEQNTGNAVHLWQCDSIEVAHNHLTSHRDGIYLEFVTHSSIIKNISQGNIRYGLHFMFSHDDNYIENQFLENASGVAVMYSRNVEMRSNIFKDNWGDASYGLLLKDITDGVLRGNTFDKNTTALLMEGTNRMEIQQNQFVSNGWALKIAANCEGNEVNQNSFLGNSFDISTNGKTVMNGFNGNYWDHYEGYDLNNDGVGDVPFHPVSLFSVMVERVPESLMLYRSFFTFLLNKSEQAMPSIIPDNLVDTEPLMAPPTESDLSYANG